MSVTPVLTAPMIDPGLARERIELPAGLTVAEIVSHSLPGLRGSDKHLRVIMVTEAGSYVAPHDLWTTMRPKPGVQVLIRTVPGKSVLRSVLLIAVSVVATVFAPGVAGALGIAGNVGTAFAAAGLTIVGQLLVNALIPIEQSQLQDSTGAETYQIDGWSNQRRPGSPVPLPAGKHRMAPPFAATSYTEVIGDDQYIRAIFCFGYGPNRLTDHRIGETPITDYEDAQIEIREGRPDDAPLGLYPKQVIEDGDGVDLVRPFPQDDAGNELTDQPTIETPVTRFTATNSAQASIIIGFPSGLFSVNSSGDLRNQSVTIRIRQRLNGEGDWQEVETLNLTNAKRETFLRQHTWDLPTRGRWQIEVTRITDDNNSTRVGDKATLVAVQSIRPEYPINLDKPLTLVAIRLRATHQLSGPLDSYNALVEKEGLVHSESGWETGYGRTPATAYLEALMGVSNPFPVVEAGIDMDYIADWHDWCVLKGLKYDRIHEDAMTLGEMLRAICAAGRASPRHDGVKWSVVIDRPDTQVIDHINPRNSEQFEWSRTYIDPPDGFRVRFLDETNDYEEAEMIVPWPGNDGDVALTESLELPGKVDPDEVWRETRRRMYEVEYRANSFSAMQSGAARVATRGDLVMGSFDILDRTVAAARVKEVLGRIVLIDEEVTVGDGYGARFKSYEGDDDLIGTSRVVAIAAREDPAMSILLEDDQAVPEPGSVIHIGPMATESTPLKVRGVEGARDFRSRILMVPAAPEIDALTDAEVPPVWDGIVGQIVEFGEDAEFDPDELKAPIFTSLSQSGRRTAAGLSYYSLYINLRVDPAPILVASGFEIDHRFQGETEWTVIPISIADGGTVITDLFKNEVIEIQARTMSGQVSSDPTPLVTIELGVDDPAVPDALEEDGISILGALGHAYIGVSVASGSATNNIQLYRVSSGETLDRSTDAIGEAIPVSAGSTTNYVDGDATRTNLLSGGGFGSADGWVEGDGWAIDAGVASHASGLPGDLSKSLSLEADKTYRVSFDVTAYATGSVTPKLTGGTDVAGSGVSSLGSVSDRLTAQSGNANITLAATSDFDGEVDDLVVFLETSGSVDAGIWDYYIEPINEIGVSGPISGPFTVKIF